MPGHRAQRVLGSVAAISLIAATSTVSARPFTLEDFLGREDLGAIEQAGGDFILERRGPTASAARFDLDANQDVERTTLWVAAPEHPQAPQLLFKPVRGTGYALGPVSPDGRRVAVMRLTATRWELGVAQIDRRRVRWLGVSPEKTADLATVLWRSNHELLVIATEPGLLPGAFRHRRELPALAPELWRRTNQGGLAVRVVQSGPGVGRRADDRALLAIDALTGRRRVLLRGKLVGLSLAPRRDRVAVIWEGADHPLSGDRPVQGVYGFEPAEHHLTLVDLGNGAATLAAKAWDVLFHPLAWSDDGRELIAFGRASVSPWTHGRVLRIDTVTGASAALDRVRAALDFRPEAARAGWFDGAPIVWGSASEGRPPLWLRETPGGVEPLAPADVVLSKDGLTRTPGGWLASGPRGVWRLSESERPVLVAPGVRPVTYPQTNRAVVFDHEISQARHLLGRGPGRALVMVTTDGVRSLPGVMSDADILRPSEDADGVLSRRRPQGSMLDLDWTGLDGRRATLARLNSGLADLDAPDLRAIHHQGPSGEPLISWLLLPRGASLANPPPLIVRPYPGASYAVPPATMDDRTGGPDKAAALLAAHGYAVLAPSLPIAAGAEPADHLADRILAIIDAAAADPLLHGRFDSARLGLWGQSFGGYGTLVTITQTDRFSAAIAESSMSDLVSVWGQFQPTLRIDPRIEFSPFYMEGWVEDLQGGMHAPPWADPQRYFRNSPIFHAERVTTPLLLFHGDHDGFSVGQPEEMFSALVRQNKPAELVTYFGEGHAFASPGTLRDQYARVFRWFDDHLLKPAGAAHPPASPEANAANDAHNSP